MSSDLPIPFYHGGAIAEIRPGQYGIFSILLFDTEDRFLPPSLSLTQVSRLFLQQQFLRRCKQIKLSWHAFPCFLFRPNMICRDSQTSNQQLGIQDTIGKIQRCLLNLFYRRARIPQIRRSMGMLGDRPAIVIPRDWALVDRFSPRILQILNIISDGQYDLVGRQPLDKQIQTRTCPAPRLLLSGLYCRICSSVQGSQHQA